jgi:Tfp pilus assembly protein PilO
MKRPPASRWTVDAIGGALVCACLAVGGWFAFGPPQQAAEALQTRRTDADQLEKDVAEMRASVQAAQARLAGTQEKVNGLGALPREMRLEKDLNTIAELARGHKLSLSQVTPLSTGEYPGLREARYAIQGTGSFADWMAFLRSFEASPFWADITNLEIGTAAGGRSGTLSAPEARLTVSFYAATDPENPTEEALATK